MVHTEGETATGHRTALGPGSEGGARNVHCYQPLQTERGDRGREGLIGICKSQILQCGPVPSDQCVGAGAAAVDTVGAPDLSQTAGLDSGCTDTGNIDYGVWVL